MLCHASGFEDIDYWVQLTGLNKQKTGPNSGGIRFSDWYIIPMINRYSNKSEI